MSSLIATDAAMAVTTDHGLTYYHPFRLSLARSLAQLWATLKLWRRRASERDQLARMDERALHHLDKGGG